MTETLTDKQQAILDATLDLIGERGFHGTPMSAIAKQAGVGAGTIYRYYESKEDLINALYVREKQALNAVLLDGYAPGMSARAAIRLIWRNGLRAREENPSRLRFLDQYYNSPFIGDETRRIREQLMGEYVEIVERGVRDGELRDLSVPVLLAMVFGPAAYLVNACAVDGLALDESLLDGILDAVWGAIGND